MKLYFPFKTAPAGAGPFNRGTAGFVEVIDGVAELDDRNPNTPDLKQCLIDFYGARDTPFPEPKTAAPKPAGPSAPPK
jgi:hypothetical protein